MAESIDRVISERLEVLSRTVFPMNYIFSKTFEYAVKHRECAMAIATKAGCQINFTQAFSVHPKMLERQGFFTYRNKAYYIRELKIIDSFIILTPDELSVSIEKDKEETFKKFRKSVVPYIDRFEDILRRRFATIVVKLPKREKPVVLHRQTVRGHQIITIDELFQELNFPKEICEPIKKTLFRVKKGLPPQKGRRKSKPVSASALTLTDGRVVLPKAGVIHAEQFIQLGEIPYHFEIVDGPVPDRQIITSFLKLENQSVAKLLEEYSELAFLPFFFDLYLEQGGPPIRHVALLDGRLIIGRSPDSNPNKGNFEVYVAQAGIDEYLSHQ
jgi:hypothetical protein